MLFAPLCTGTRLVPKPGQATRGETGLSLTPVRYSVQRAHIYCVQVAFSKPIRVEDDPIESF